MKHVNWVYVVCGFVVIVVIAGGSSLQDREHFLLLTFLSLAMLSVGLWRLRGVELDTLSLNGLLLLILGFGLMFLQLIPLPPMIWSVMGGRGFVVESLAATQQSDAWQALSLSPYATRQDILSLLPAAATFIALLSVSRESHASVAIGIGGLAVVGMLFLLEQSTVQVPSGGFMNPNFFAAQLYMSIPFVVHLATQSAQKKIWILAGALVLLSVVSIGQSGSRLGLLIGVAVTLASVINLQRVNRSIAAHGLIVFSALTVVVLLFGGDRLERFMGLQTALAARANMFSTSLRAMIEFLPAGSGFGSFVPVYQLFEAPASVMPTYVNHAHNDWLELVIEGGLPAAALMIAFLRWFSLTAQRNWNVNSEFGRAAVISASAVLFHSMADYPLRTPALLCLFACCCGMMVRAGAVRKLDFATKFRRQSESSLAHTRAAIS